MFSRRISLTRVSKLLRLVSISTGLSIPESRHAKGAFRRRRNHARTFVLSLNERRITLSFSLHSRSVRERKKSRPIIIGQSHVEASRAAIIRTFTNRLGERCENYRRETLSLDLSCPLGTALKETGRLRPLNSRRPHREKRYSRGSRCARAHEGHICETCVHDTAIKNA